MRLIALLFGALALIGVVLLYQGRLGSQLVRVDPSAIIANSAQGAFAITRGKRVFEAECAQCHGRSARGDPTRGVPDLTDGEWLYGDGSVADIEQVITYGIRSNNSKAWNLTIMPAYARSRPSARDPAIPSLSAAEIRDLVELIVYQKGGPANPDAASRGAGLYSGKAGCYDCHGADMKGDSATGVPSLSSKSNLYGDGSRDDLFISIGYGHQGVCPAWIRRLSRAAIREVAFYAHVLSLAPHKVVASSALLEE